MNNEMNHHNHDCDMWDWRCDEFSIDDNGTTDMSKCLLDGTCQSEDFSSVFDNGTTPVKACGDLICHENTNKDFGQCSEGSSQVKRRRMLQFASEAVETTFCVEDMPSAFLRSHETSDSFEAPLLEMEQWVSGFSGGESVSGDIIDPSSEGWLDDCLIDTNFCSDDVNTADASEVQIDITDICATPEYENNTVQAPPPVRTRQNVVFKGRKSYMESPTKKASSIVSPFAFIKPCSFEGNVTLKDINQRLRDPALKSKQKKQERSAAYPTSAFSGKPVVGKTKINTEGGKGSITIMRTKG